MGRIARQIGREGLQCDGTQDKDRLFLEWATEFQNSHWLDQHGWEERLAALVRRKAADCGFRRTEPWMPISLATIKALSQSDEPTVWLYHTQRGVLLGRYEWRQGWDPDRFLTDGGDVHALDPQFTHFMPYARPSPPPPICVDEEGPTEVGLEPTSPRAGGSGH